VNGTRTRREVFVSNRHVLLADGAGRGDPVYSSEVLRDETVVVRGGNPAPVGEIDDEGQESNYRFAYPGEPEKEYFVDCATALVATPIAELAATARLLGLDRATPPSGVARLHPLDVVGRRSPKVTKMGRDDVVVGRVVDVAGSVDVAGKGRRLNNVVVRLDDPAKVGPGDSGALLVNDRREAVALLWGRDDSDPRIAYACHIHPVLARLRATMVTEEMR
jgi:hypothetical protein